MIENNTTYRGFIYDSKDRGQWDMGFFDAFIKESGHLGLDFAAYYKGNPKLGDTPSLLYMMSGDPAKPTDYVVGSQWWTDSYAPSHYWKDCAGAALQRAVRQESMQAWAERWQWLRK